MNDHNYIKEFLQGWKDCQDEIFATHGCSDAYLDGWKEVWNRMIAKENQGDI